MYGNALKIPDTPGLVPANVQIPGWLLPGSPRDRRFYVAAYDDEIAAADVAFDTLIREFRDLRPSRPSVVVLTADHGEEFMAHGGWEHNTTLYDVDELVRARSRSATAGSTGAILLWSGGDAASCPGGALSDAASRK